MTTIYELTGRMVEIDAQLDELYTINEGECTEETEALEALKAEIIDRIVAAPDEYASWYKNTDAQLKAKKEAKKEMVAKYDSRIKALERKQEWIKGQILTAMQTADILKLKGQEFSISVSNTDSLDCNEELALAHYQQKIDELNATLPEWLQVVPKVSKTALKGANELPEGFSKVTTTSIRVR